MLDSAFESVLGGTTEGAVSALTGSSFLLCSLASLVLGLAIAGIYMFKHKYNKNFVVTIALLPIIVQMVISLVNGNIGAGVAVMGVFNLVRFRSIPGTAKDICAVFLAMAVGLATGMGYLTLAVLFTVVVGIANVIFVLSPLGERASGGKGTKAEKPVEKTLKVAIPENVDYMSAFDDLFARYCTKSELQNAKSTNMGSMFQLEYTVTLADPKQEKLFIDELRTRNGNLTVSMARAAAKEKERETL